jgi:hypothetical protein
VPAPVDLALFDSWGRAGWSFTDFLRLRTRTKSLCNLTFLREYLGDFLVRTAELTQLVDEFPVRLQPRTRRLFGQAAENDLKFFVHGRFHLTPILPDNSRISAGHRPDECRIIPGQNPDELRTKAGQAPDCGRTSAGQLQPARRVGILRRSLRDGVLLVTFFPLNTRAIDYSTFRTVVLLIRTALVTPNSSALMSCRRALRC